jgi:hypothetical protein
MVGTYVDKVRPAVVLSDRGLHQSQLFLRTTQDLFFYCLLRCQSRHLAFILSREGGYAAGLTVRRLYVVPSLKVANAPYILGP